MVVVTFLALLLRRRFAATMSRRWSGCRMGAGVCRSRRRRMGGCRRRARDRRGRAGYRWGRTGRRRRRVNYGRRSRRTNNLRLRWRMSNRCRWMGMRRRNRSWLGDRWRATVRCWHRPFLPARDSRRRQVRRSDGFGRHLRRRRGRASRTWRWQRGSTLGHMRRGQGGSSSGDESQLQQNVDVLSRPLVPWCLQDLDASAPPVN